MKTYDKLVRDRIPEIIRASEKNCKTRILDPEEFRRELKRKLQEEVDEYIESENLEELADILEVLHSLANSLNFSIKELDECRIEKREARGGFESKIFLEWVD